MNFHYEFITKLIMNFGYGVHYGAHNEISPSSLIIKLIMDHYQIKL